MELRLFVFRHADGSPPPYRDRPNPTAPAGRTADDTRRVATGFVRVVPR